MSDLPLSDDELLSCLLDGELTAEEHTLLDARLENEPELHARLAALRTAAELIATPVPKLQTSDTEQLIAAALATSTTSAANVTDLQSARERKHQWRTRLITAAAAIAAIAIPALQSNNNNNNNDYDTASTEESGSAESPAEDSGGSDAAADGDDSAAMEFRLESDMAESDTADTDSDAIAPTVGDTGDEESVEESDGPDEPQSDEPGAPPTFVSGVDFDPLIDDLGRFDRAADVSASAATAWKAYTSSGPGDVEAEESGPDGVADATIGGDGEEFNAVATGLLARERLADFGGCVEHFDEIGADDFAAPVIAVDYTIANVGDTLFTIGLFQLADESAVLLLLDSYTCVISEIFLLDAP